MILRHKKTCRNKLTLSSGTLMFRLKENFSVFCNFFDQWNFSIEDCTLLHCSALAWTNIFVQLSLDITFHTIECGVTTFPVAGASCHTTFNSITGDLPLVVINNLSVAIARNPILFNCSQGFTQTLEYHSLSRYWMQKIQKSWNKMCAN